MTQDLLELQSGFQAGLSLLDRLPRLAFAEAEITERAESSSVDQYAGPEPRPAPATGCGWTY